MARKGEQFAGLTVAIVTPFKNGLVDEAALRKTVDWHVAQGTNGLCPVGTTGECPTLSTVEHERVIAVVCEQAAGRIKVMAGTGSNSTTEAIELTRDFLASTYAPVAKVALAGGTLKEAMSAARAHCDAKFKSYAIYEHCLPFNVARAYDEALGLDTPRIWTAARDKQMWAALQG